jgi:glutaredoxin-like protein
MLQERDRQAIQERFTRLVQPVTLTLFIQPESGLYIPGRQPTTSRETRQLLEEVVSLSDLLSLQVVDVTADPAAAEAAQVIGVPTLILRGPEDGRVRMLGLPAGYEFATLIETILAVSSGETGIAGEVVAALDQLPEPIDVQVFVTPTCPHCPRTASLALKLAACSPKVRASVIEANEFWDLSERYAVSAVPQTVFTFPGRAQPGILIGGGPPERFLGELFAYAGIAWPTTVDEGQRDPTQ